MKYLFKQKKKYIILWSFGVQVLSRHKKLNHTTQRSMKILFQINSYSAYSGRFFTISVPTSALVFNVN